MIFLLFFFFDEIKLALTLIQEPLPSQITQLNAAQKMVDSVNYISETVTNMSAKPSKMIGSWVADQIAPSYWVPNARIQVRAAKQVFHSKISSSLFN